MTISDLSSDYAGKYKNPLEKTDRNKRKIDNTSIKHLKIKVWRIQITGIYKRAEGFK